MPLSDAIGLSDSQERYLTRALQALLAGLFLYGLATFQLGMALNGATALALTCLPAIIRREYGYSMDAGLVLWISVAVFLHSIGSLGPYDWFGWYDSVTHTISATIIAGFGYAAFTAFERHSDQIDTPPEFRAVFIVVFVLAMGVLWEILEFGMGTLGSLIAAEPPLVVYGVEDIVTDMVFNTLGAILVALWGTQYVDGLTSFFRRRLRSEGE